MNKTLAAVATVAVMGALAITAYRWSDRGVRMVDADASPSPSAVQSARTARRDSTAPAISPNAAPIAGGVRKIPSDPQLLPPGPVRDYLPGLLAQANAPNASAEASFKAFMALNSCYFQAARARARGPRQSEGEKPVPATPTPSEPDCRGVKPEDWADPLRYLKRAAEIGDGSPASDHAIYVYGSGLPLLYLSREDLIAHPEAVLEWRQDASRMLLGAAASGSLDAMFGLSSAYETGRFGETSPLLAYEYAFTEREIAGHSVILDGTVDRLAANLTPDQIGSAQQAAQGFIARCCKSR